MRLSTAVLAIGGILGAMPIVYSQIHGDHCPMLGPVPACYVVMSAYVLLLGAVFLPKPWRAYVFVPAWLVVFAIAALAVGFELFIPHTCPVSRFGIPTCFVSLVIALLLAFAYAMEKKFDREFE